MRQAGEVVYADAHRIRTNEGFVLTLLRLAVVGSLYYFDLFTSCGISRTKRWS